MKLLPLTKGLLVSMAMRAEHMFLAPYQNIQIGNREVPFGLTDQDRVALIEDMRSYYMLFLRDDYNAPEWKAGDNTELQVLEEATGQGFYQPSKEESYAVDYPNEADYP